MNKIMEGYTVPSDTRRHLFQELARAKYSLGDHHVFSAANSVRKDTRQRKPVLGRRAYA